MKFIDSRGKLVARNVS